MPPPARSLPKQKQKIFLATKPLVPGLEGRWPAGVSTGPQAFHSVLQVTAGETGHHARPPAASPGLRFLANFCVLRTFRALAHLVLTTTRFTGETTEALRTKVAPVRSPVAPPRARSVGHYSSGPFPFPGARRGDTTRLGLPQV